MRTVIRHGVNDNGLADS